MKKVCSVVCVLFAGVAAASTVQVPREELVNAVKEATFVPVTVAPDETRRKQMLSEVRSGIEAEAPTLLPEKLEAFSHEAAIRAASRPFVIQFDDDRWIRLSIRQQLMLLKMALKYEIAHPPLDKAGADRVKQSVAPIFSSMKLGMHQHLLEGEGKFSEKAIDDAVVDLVNECYGKVDDPEFYALKLPLKKEDTDRIEGQFEQRLEESASLLEKRLDRDAPKGSDGKRDAAREEFTRKLILQEMVNPTRQLIFKLTTDDSRKMKMGGEDPEFMKVQEEMGKLLMELSKRGQSGDGEK